MLMVPPKTSSPADFAAGMLSPVSTDSSTLDDPFATVPSTGTFSPGRTCNRSPAFT
jgi:hypothetical protein